MEFVFLVLASVVAGMANAVAGGGTFVTFPALIAAGLPPVLANATNSVAVSPANALASYAYRSELARSRPLLLRMGIVSAIGGVAGAVLLMLTDERVFVGLVPWLLLFTTLLFAIGPMLSRWLSPHGPARPGTWKPMLLCLVASVYGGYFGAGLGIMLMSIFTLAGVPDVHEANALKNFISTIVYAATIVALAGSGLIVWRYALPMFLGAVIGGLYGGKLARKLNPILLRTIVVATGLALSIYYFLK